MIFKKDVTIYRSNKISTEKFYKWITNYYGAVILCLFFKEYTTSCINNKKIFQKDVKLDGEDHSQLP
jgi:hypothetical protein